MTWYHGTVNRFDQFEPEFLGKGNDELGSGFYFTDSYETALLYAGRDGGDRSPAVLVVEFIIEKPLPEAGGLSRQQVERLLCSSPDFDDVLMNFGDVDYEGRESVLKLAVDTYLKTIEGDTLVGLNSMSNDFFDGNEALFLERLHQITGYDGLYKGYPNARHAVVWRSDAIKIIERQDLEPRGLQLP